MPARRRARTIELHLMGVRTVTSVCAAEMDQGGQCPAIVLGASDAPEVNGGPVPFSGEVEPVPLCAMHVRAARTAGLSMIGGRPTTSRPPRLGPDGSPSRR